MIEGIHPTPSNDNAGGAGVPATPAAFLEFLTDLFRRGQAMAYGPGKVSMCAHMLQTADLAAEAGAPPALVAASLLHDVGHFGTDYPFDFEDESHATMQTASEDRRHEDAGAAMLLPFFGPDVAEPVRLHVPAKRYLCAIDDAYYDHLSATTRHTLGLQGGPMTAAEADAFARLPHAEAAAQLRRWDDEAMVADRPVPGFVHYAELLAGLITRPGA
ncbi:MAG: HD domain-containing protein [Magnetovibrio sp.]|nr:HD domain-containing protein [Magnetovibrio sp.]